MTTNERALGVIAVAAICAALFAWSRWSDADAVASYYRSDYYKYCLQSAANTGATIELALFRCHDDAASVRIAAIR